MISPARNTNLPKNTLSSYSFGNLPQGFGLHDGYKIQNKENIKILLLSCGEFPFALENSCNFSEHMGVLEITLTDSVVTVAKNIFILKVINNESFDEENLEDLHYLWDVLYNMEWSEATLQRFLNDVTSLCEGNLPKNVKVPEQSHTTLLKKTWSSWMSSASNMDPSFFQKIQSQRYESIIKIIHSSLCPETPLPLNYIKTPLAEVWDFLFASTKIQMDLSHLPEYHHQAISKEIRSYFESGSNKIKAGDKVVSINPTLLHPTTHQWALDPLTHPFQLYLHRSNLVLRKDFLSTCQLLLGEELKHCKNLLKTTPLSFYIGDALTLCYNQYWNDCFDVVDCSHVPDSFGLANILITARMSLADNNEALIITQSSPWPENSTSTTYSSGKEFVELSLGSQVSMLPTLYGLTLVNHVMLGNLLPLKGSRRSSICLFWKKALCYSPNVEIDTSSSINQFIDEMHRRCFVGVESSINEKYTPLTFGYLTASLSSRVSLSEPLCQALIAPQLSSPFQLAWKTIRAWMDGRKIIQITATLSLINKDAGPLRLVLASYAQSRVHFIDNVELSWDSENKNILASFLLLEDHQLNLKETVVYLAYGIASIPVTVPCPLKDASITEFFSYPTIFQSNHLKSTSTDEKQTKIVSCLEFDDSYKVHLCIHGLEHIDDLILLTDKAHPSEAGHQVTLMPVGIEGALPMLISFPCAFSAADIQTVLDPDSRSIEIMIPKSIYEPHPFEWHWKRWGAEKIKEEWNPENLIKDLNFHLSAQFEFQDLKAQILGAPEPCGSGTGLRGIREIIRTLFHSTILDENRLFVITTKRDPKPKKLWFLRVHLPIRVSPLGFPMLLMTANDHGIAQQLVDNGLLSQTKATEDFMRIFVEGAPPSGVCPIFVQSEEEEKLLRYVLRVNSAKLKSDDWPIENFPNGEDSPWLATFVSPLYVDVAGTDAEMEDLIATTQKFSPKDTENVETVEKKSQQLEECCSKCQLIKDNLKRCSRCKKAKYCSLNCQRSDWAIHKSSCS